MTAKCTLKTDNFDTAQLENIPINQLRYDIGIYSARLEPIVKKINSKMTLNLFHSMTHFKIVI